MKNTFTLFTNIMSIGFIFSMVSLIACVKNKNLTSTRAAQFSKDFKVIGINNIYEKQKIDTIIQSYFYLPLQTNKNCLIGKIDKIVINNNRIYILDKAQTKSIFVYDINGKFVFKINKIGKGLGEYDNIRDFDIDMSGNQIVVLCPNFRKLIFYNTTNGLFLKEQKLDFRPLSFIKVNLNRYLFDCKVKLEKNMGNNMLMVADSFGNIPIGYFPRTNYTSTEKTPFSRFKDYIYYCSNYNDTIFSYRNDTLLKKYYIDFGKRKLDITSLPKELFDVSGVIENNIVPFLNQNKFAKYVQSKDIAYHITSFFESDSFIRFQFIYGQKIFNALFDKTSQHLKTYYELEQTEEICYGLTTYAAYKDSFVSVINSDILAQILSYREKKDSINLHTIRKKVHLPDKITLEDNPLLIFINYKNF